MKLESDTSTLLPPLFQPLRLWTPRVVPQVTQRGTGSVSIPKSEQTRTFAMRGGFVTTHGERRLVLAGKLFRSRG